jgi:hypothetical protein
MRPGLLNRLLSAMGQRPADAAVEAAFAALRREASAEANHLRKTQEFAALCREADQAWNGLVARVGAPAKWGAFGQWAAYIYFEWVPRSDDHFAERNPHMAAGATRSRMINM